MEQHEASVEEGQEAEEEESPGYSSSWGSQPSAYPYHHLMENDVRLLRILPGDGPIECILHQMPLAEELMFYALSYVWGKSNERADIKLEGKSFQVTRNLHEALQYLRDRDDVDGYIWIDAICLNQSNLEEKSMQIPRMVDIYRAALAVFIWLGSNAAPSNKPKILDKRASLSLANPVELLRNEKTCSDSMVELLFDKATSLWEDWELPDDESEEERVLRDVFGSSYDAVLQATAGLLQRQWFKRIWTIQECIFDISATVLAGRYKVDLSRFIKLVKTLAFHNRVLVLASGYSRIVALDQLTAKYDNSGVLARKSASQRIITVLAGVRNKEATDPRDQLYGLLGIVTYKAIGPLPVELTPDYSIPFEKVYWDYTTYLLKNTGDLRLLPEGDYELPGVPSWVPDFRYTALRGKQINCKTVIEISEDKRILFLSGLRMQPICDIVDEWDDPRTYRDGIQTEIQHRIRYIEGRIFKLASQIRGRHLRDTLDEVFWRQSLVFQDGGMEGIRRVYTDLRGHSSRSGAWLSKRGRSQTVDEFGKRFALADELRYSHVLLEDGTIVKINRTGVEVLLSDIICLFKGAANPSLLRPSPNRESIFILLSQCIIVSGTFHRQSLDEIFWTEKDLEQFQLV
ncbi:heterokaryon incompatibility protein-domain-containing protein [Xylariaceae sp. FL0255]|nr:heterokaryon incompatibility protein-domain-containing protein [Xylariaceae sp. FL0255]